MKRALLLITFLALLWPSYASTADAKAPKSQKANKAATATVPDSSVKPATLAVDNREIFTFRANLYGYSPEQRVEGADARLKSIIDKGLMNPVSAKKAGDNAAIMIGDHLIFMITPGDLNTLAGETMDEASQRVVAKLSKALAEIEEAGRAETFIRGTAYTAAATVILFLFLAGVWRARRWVKAQLDEIADSRLKSLAIGGFTQHIEWIVIILGGLVGLAAWMLILISLNAWLSFSLLRFPYTRPWGEQLNHYMIAGAQAVVLTLVDLIPGLVIVAVIIFITRFLMRLVNLFFDAVEGGGVTIWGLDPDTAHPTRKIVTFILWVFAVIMMYPYLPGSQSDAFKGVSVFVGLLLSIGSAGSVNQVVSGLMLMYSRALRVGDYVQIGETVGTVTSLGLLSTRILTPWKEIVSLPNAFILSTTTKNYSREEETGGALLTTTVTIGYNAPWRQVHAMLIEAARRTEGLVIEPHPQVMQRSLSDYYVEYLLSARIAKPNTRIAVLDVLHRNIQDVFNEYGVQIMSPHYMSDPAEKVWVPRENWYEAPAKKEEDKT